MDQKNVIPQNSSDSLSFLPLSGIEDVTKNLYVYEYQDEILIVDCGIGFADETMLGVDLLLPDISYLLNVTSSHGEKSSFGGKKIVGMALTHGHEDHIGALPFLLPQLPKFPIFASPLTAALVNEKLREFNQPPVVQKVELSGGEVKVGKFNLQFLRITHSVPDTANIVIKTPVGNFYHGSDFKFDLTPGDGKKTDFQKITKAGEQGIVCLMSDCLGAERPGHTRTEANLGEEFEQEMKECKGKFIVTTYSSNITRINQAIRAAEHLGRKVCFVGRSLIKVKAIAQNLGYLTMKGGTEVALESVRKFDDNKLLLLVAGSQGQENSALTRIAEGEHKDVKITPGDTVVFSSDTIPGNEITVNSLIDTLSKRGAKVLYSDITDRFHVSGHGSSNDLMLMIALTKPRFLLPISGTYKQMVAYRRLAVQLGYAKNDVFLMENGQEIIFSNKGAKLGRKIPVKKVYVDQMSGEEVEGFVLRDREKLAKEGIVIVMVEVSVQDGQIVNTPDIIARGFSTNDTQVLEKALPNAIRTALSGKKGKMTSRVHVRNTVSDTAHHTIFKALRKRPLVLPVIIEV